MGLSLAFYLAKGGQDVCVVERSFVGAEGSGRSAGGIRQNNRPPAELALAMRSVELWKELAQESDIGFEYQQHGNLALIWNEETAAEAVDVMMRQQAAGLECTLLDRQETRSLVPAIVDGYLGGLYSPTCGSAEPYLSCVALARLARRHGATICEGTTVTAIRVTQGKVAGVDTSAGAIDAPAVVDAAGPWAPLIAQMVGLHFPGRLCRSHILVTETLPTLLVPFTACGDYGYFRQTRSGNLLIGFGGLPVADYSKRRTSYEAVAIATRRAATIIPRLRSVSIIRTFTGFNMWTPDSLPILGPVQHPQGFYLAAEMNGTGFALGPACGKLLAEWMLNGRPSLSMDAFTPARFGERRFDGSKN
jgi:sarcosine oxidase subunit beta